jgi:hypothetical protein
MTQSERPSENPRPKKLSVLAVLSFILSFIPYVGIAFGILLGMPSLRGIKKSNGELSGRWLAIGGIVVACLQILFVCGAIMSPSLLFPRQHRAIRMESNVKYTAHTFQLAIEDYKQDPKHQGLKPAADSELTVVVQSYLPASFQNKKNPFDTSQGYCTVGSGFVFGPPSSPGQVGYVFTDQREPYKIIALGRDGKPILTLVEKIGPSQAPSDSKGK